MIFPYPDLATARAVFDTLRKLGHRVAIDPKTCTVIVEKAKR